MKISVRDAGETKIVDLDGDIDLSASPLLRKNLFEALQQAPRLAVNLAGIRYIDSSGIAILLETLREAHRLSRSLVLFGLNDAVHEVFKLTHVNRIFDIKATEEQAVLAT